jgi:hypothetical protein
MKASFSFVLILFLLVLTNCEEEASPAPSLDDQLSDLIDANDVVIENSFVEVTKRIYYNGTVKQMFATSATKKDFIDNMNRVIEGVFEAEWKKLQAEGTVATFSLPAETESYRNARTALINALVAERNSTNALAVFAKYVENQATREDALEPNKKWLPIKSFVSKSASTVSAAATPLPVENFGIPLQGIKAVLQQYPTLRTLTGEKRAEFFSSNNFPNSIGMMMTTTQDGGVTHTDTWTDLNFGGATTTDAFWKAGLLGGLWQLINSEQINADQNISSYAHFKASFYLGLTACWSEAWDIR